MANTKLALSRKTSFCIILVITLLIVFDSTVVEFSSYSGIEASYSWNIAIFTTFLSIFATVTTLLIISVSTLPNPVKVVGVNLGYFQKIVLGIQISTIIIISIIIFQMHFLNEYAIVLPEIQAYLSHISALLLLSLLVYLFCGWLISKRNYGVILYIVSLSLVCINLVVSLIYVAVYLSNANSSMVKPFPIAAYVTNYSVLSIESIAPLFDALSFSSFMFMWIATVILLRQYRFKMGKAKYILLTGIPLIYYVLPFQSYFSDAFFAMLPSSPVSASLLYVLIFSATRQVGAFLFSMSFWTASSLVHDDKIRKSLLVSSIGIACVFSSMEIAPLQYHVYPPYGLITKAFMPIGAYLLFIGIFTSAVKISRDTEVRKEFYKRAESQLTLLRSIGVSQMEKELEGEIRSVEERSKSFQPPSEPELEEQDIKQILNEVLNELYYSKQKKETQEQ